MDLKSKGGKKWTTILAWSLMTLLCLFLPMIYAIVMTVIQKISGKDTKKTTKYEFLQVTIFEKNHMLNHAQFICII